MAAGLMELFLSDSGMISYYIVKDPKITFFKSVYRRHANFSPESKPQPFLSKIDFGKTVTCMVGKLGDMMSNVMLYLRLPSIDFYTSAYNIIDYVELRIGGLSIIKMHGEYMHNIQLLESSSLPAYKKLTEGYEVYLPIPFSFTKSPADALPLVAMSSIVQLIVKTNPVHKVYPPLYSIRLLSNHGLINIGDKLKQGTVEGKAMSYNPITRDLTYVSYSGPFVNGLSINQATPITNSVKITRSAHPKIIDGNMFIEYVYLSDEERQDIMTKSHRILFEQVDQTVSRSQSQNINHVINLSKPTKAIYWSAKLDKGMPHNYSTSSIGDENSLIKAVTMDLGNMKRMNISEHEYYNLIQPYQHHTNPAPTGLGMYSFSLYPENQQPSGSMSGGTLKKIQLVMRLDNIVSINNAATITSWTVNYNYLIVGNFASENNVVLAY